MPPFLRDLDEGSSQSFVPEAKKSIRFALEENEVFPVAHLNDLQEWEIQKMWLTRQDYDEIKMRIIPAVRRLMRGETLDENVSNTARGLEYRTKKGAQKRLANKQNALHAVLDEQQRQIDGVQDENRIAFIYRRMTAHCATYAQDLASQDEVEVKSFASSSSLSSSDHSTEGRQERNCFRRAPSAGTDSEQSLTDRHFRGVSRLLKQMRIRRLPIVDDAPSTPAAAKQVVGQAA